MKQIGKSIKAPLVANMIEGGATPISSAQELHKWDLNNLVPVISIVCKYFCYNEHTTRIKEDRNNFKIQKQSS